MHDIRTIRDNPDAFIQGLKRRGLDGDALARDVLERDKALRELLTRLQTQQARRNDASKLIGQAKPAPNKQVASLTPLGSPTQNAPRMSPSLSASLDGWLQDAYLSCWTQPPTMPEGVKYVAQVRVSFNPDGSLSAQPQLVNPPSDPAWRAYAESSMRAVLKCNPLRVPPQYVPYFQQWKVKTVHFDPENAQG